MIDLEAYDPINEGDLPPHPLGCRNGWLAEDVECPACVAEHEARQEQDETSALPADPFELASAWA